MWPPFGHRPRSKFLLWLVEAILCYKLLHIVVTLHHVFKDTAVPSYILNSIQILNFRLGIVFTNTQFFPSNLLLVLIKKQLKYTRSVKLSHELIKYQERREQSFDQFGILETETTRLFGGQMEVSWGHLEAELRAAHSQNWKQLKANFCRLESTLKAEIWGGTWLLWRWCHTCLSSAWYTPPPARLTSLAQPRVSPLYVKLDCWVSNTHTFPFCWAILLH